MKKNKLGDIAGRVGWGLLIFLAVVITIGMITRAVSTISTTDDYELPAVFEDSLVEKSDQMDSRIMKKAVVDGCTGEAEGQRAYCECFYDYLERRLGTKGIMTMSIEVDKNNVSKTTADTMADAVYYCIDQYDMSDL